MHNLCSQGVSPTTLVYQSSCELAHVMLPGKARGTRCPRARVNVGILISNKAHRIMGISDQGVARNRSREDVKKGEVCAPEE